MGSFLNEAFVVFFIGFVTIHSFSNSHSQSGSNFTIMPSFLPLVFHPMSEQSIFSLLTH